MDKQHLLKRMILGLSAIGLTACGLAPVQSGQSVTLQPGQGIAAVVLDTLDPINAFYIKPVDNSGAPYIEINHVEVGVHLFVFVVPSGSYCVSRYSVGAYYLTANDQRHGVCFDVIAGKVAYSGNLSPRVYNGGIVTNQNYYWSAFEKIFKQQYPKLAVYPIVTP